MARALRVGLTGGIACGKSRVQRRLAAAGFVTIDLDRLAHELMEPPGEVHSEVVAAFGPGILSADGKIDRRALGELVFGDGEARRRLEAIVHPRVREEEVRRAARSAGASVVVTEAALLVETGMHPRFDRLVVVHCSPETQLSRLRSRDGIGEEEAHRRIAAQMPIEEKRHFAHLEIATEGPLSATDAAADLLAQRLRVLAHDLRPGTGSIDLRPAVDGLIHGPRTGPRGLDPLALLLEIERSGGLEMQSLAALIQPASAGPWYQAARSGQGAPYPATLAGPVAAWSLVRAPEDEEFTVGLMASVARLSHREPDAIGNACTFALATRSAWSPARPGPQRLLEEAPRWLALARPWAGGEFPDRVRPVLAAAASDPSGERAREACARELGEPALAGTLLGRGGDAGEGLRARTADALDRLARALSDPAPG